MLSLEPNGGSHSPPQDRDLSWDQASDTSLRPQAPRAPPSLTVSTEILHGVILLSSSKALFWSTGHSNIAQASFQRSQLIYIISKNRLQRSQSKVLISITFKLIYNELYALTPLLLSAWDVLKKKKSGVIYHIVPLFVLPEI